MAIVKCDACPGLKHDNRFGSIRLPKKDADGNPVLGPGGNPAYTFVRLPIHIVAPSVLEPTGFAGATCEHGLPKHPNPNYVGPDRKSRSFIRARYLDGSGRCPVCRGLPAPEDMLLPRDGSLVPPQ